MYTSKCRNSVFVRACPVMFFNHGFAFIYLMPCLFYAAL